MKKLSLMGLMGLLALVALAFWFVPNASAHEHREVGDYEIAFGWQVEPAIAGVFNGPELFITTHEDGKPLEGAEETLKLKVTFGNQSRDLKLSPAWQEPGHYVAHLTPTRAGDYTFQVTGTISSTAVMTATLVKETFSSADGEFSSVEPASDVLFPDTKWDGAGFQAQIDALKAQVDALKKELEAVKAAKK